MFRVYIGKGKMSLTDLETRLNDWKTSNNQWTDDSIAHELNEYRDIDGNLICHQMSIRFEQTDTKANLLQKLTDKLENKVDWYRVGYHACDHDEENSSPCSWDDVVEWTAKDVTIPNSVPTFQ
jgi:hypothetical protein